MKYKKTIKSKFFHEILDNRNKSGYNILYKIFGRIIMANAKNYTDEMVAQMTEQ